MDVSFSKLGLVLHADGRQVLQGVTGNFDSGRVAAIMGPSGVGKTTFLNTLCGRATYGEATGEVFVNGERSPGGLRGYTSLVGLVPQDDIMHRWLTVKENLWLYAKLRHRKRLSPDTVNDKVNAIMHVLGLFEHRHVIIGDDVRRGISGGQRKRVNVAMELVLEPSLLFLDEPTSGLDSTTSYDLIVALKAIAARGVNIVAVVHQPSAKIYREFHDVLLLGRGGCTVFLGRSEDALPYFSALGFQCPQLENPADFFMDVIAGKVTVPGIEHDPSSELPAVWEAQSARHDQRTPRTADNPPAAGVGSGAEKPSLDWQLQAALIDTYLPTWCEATWLFAVRALFEHTRFPTEFMYELVLQLLTGVVVGALYTNFTFHDLQQMNFMMALAVGFTIALSSMRVFGEGMLVHWREAAPGVGMGLSQSAYFVAKCLVELPRLAFLTLMLLCTFYPMASPRCPFSIYFGICFAAAFCVSGWAYILSIAQDPKSAQLSVVVVMVIMSMFSGVAPRLSAIDRMGPVPKALTWLSFARWYIECLYTEETKRMSDAWRMPPTFYKSSRTSSALLGLQGFSYVEESTLDNVLILLLMGLVTRVIAYQTLVHCNRDQMGLPTLHIFFVRHVLNPLYDFLESVRNCCCRCCYGRKEPDSCSPVRRSSLLMRMTGEMDEQEGLSLLPLRRSATSR